MTISNQTAVRHDYRQVDRTTSKETAAKHAWSRLSILRTASLRFATRSLGDSHTTQTSLSDRPPHPAIVRANGTDSLLLFFICASFEPAPRPLTHVHPHDHPRVPIRHFRTEPYRSVSWLPERASIRSRSTAGCHLINSFVLFPRTEKSSSRKHLSRKDSLKQSRK